MRDVYSVKGSESAYGGTEKVLIVTEAETNRPVMMNAYGGMMDYLNEVGGTDVEEKYLDKIFVYNSWCSLEAIVIPSTREHLPAKVIIMNGKDHSAKVFGPETLIDTIKPEPMPWEDWKAAWEYALDNEDYNLRRHI